MNDGSLIACGATGSVIAAICCATPILAITFGVLGLSAWLGWADYVVVPLLVVCLAMLAVGLWRRRAQAR